MKNILVTGASGFLGRAIVEGIAHDCRVRGLYFSNDRPATNNAEFRYCNMCHAESLNQVFSGYAPDVVVHSAGIAHQRLGTVDSKDYMRVNSDATESLARAAASANPSVTFVFFSSISVYGEQNLSIPVTEDHPCHPSSPYGESKLNAEKRLNTLVSDEKLRRLYILRLGPVYDRNWSFNLNRRVLAPMNLCYVKFGSGHQQMSALARPNLSDLIRFIVLSDDDDEDQIHVMNVTDAEPYAFNRVIKVFMKSHTQPRRPAVRVPLSVVFVLSRLCGWVVPGRREWFHSAYKKLASSLIFDNTKMLQSGYRPRHDLESVFIHNNG